MAFIGRHRERLRDIVPGVRALVIVLVLAGGVIAGCGGKQAGSSGGSGVATVFPAARFVPANPTFVVSAKTSLQTPRLLREFGAAAFTNRRRFAAG